MDVWMDGWMGDELTSKMETRKWMNDEQIDNGCWSIMRWKKQCIKQTTKKMADEKSH